MKKNLLFILVIIVMMVALIGVMVACKGEAEQEPTTPVDTDGLTESTFYEAAQSVEKPKTNISLVSVQDNIEIYSMNSNEKEENRYNIPFDGGSFVNSSDALLSYRSDSFSEATIKGTKLTGKLADAKTFFGITDSSTTISNAVVVISLESDEETLSKIELTFDMTIDSIAYQATITVTP